jgi:hypothetical protein
MQKLDWNELFGMTFCTVDKIMENKNWSDGLALYFKYYKQYRIQWTNQTRSTDKFMKKWLWWWNTRFSNAKKVLKELWLIDIIQWRDNKWKMTTCYVKVNFLINEDKIRNHQLTYEMQSTPPEPQITNSGKWPTNALITKTKCLKNKNNNIHEINFAYLISSFWLSRAMIEKWFDYKKSLEQIVRDCEAIKYISSQLWIFPVYDKETINATDMMLNKWYSVEDIIDFVKDEP